MPPLSSLLTACARLPLYASSRRLRTSFGIESGPSAFPFRRLRRSLLISSSITSGGISSARGPYTSGTASSWYTGGAGKNFSARIRTRSVLLSTAVSFSVLLRGGIYGSACALPTICLLYLDRVQSFLLAGALSPTSSSISRRQLALTFRLSSYFS